MPAKKKTVKATPKQEETVEKVEKGVEKAQKASSEEGKLKGLCVAHGVSLDGDETERDIKNILKAKGVI